MKLNRGKSQHQLHRPTYRADSEQCVRMQYNADADLHCLSLDDWQRQCKFKINNEIQILHVLQIWDLIWDLPIKDLRFEGKWVFWIWDLDNWFKSRPVYWKLWDQCGIWFEICPSQVTAQFHRIIRCRQYALIHHRLDKYRRYCNQAIRLATKHSFGHQTSKTILRC